MPQPWADSRLFLLAFIGLGGFCLGLLSMVIHSAQDGRPRAPYYTIIAALVLGLAGFSIAAAWSRQPSLVWAPPLVLIGAFFALWLLLTHPLVDKGLAYLPALGPRLIRSSAWALFMVGSLVVGLREGLFDEDDDPDGSKAVAALEKSFAGEQPPSLEEIPGLSARTDKGRPIKLYRPPSPETWTTDVEILRRQKKMLGSMGLSEQVIALGLSTQGTNCFGVVFAGAKYWIKAEDVPAILEENNYHKVDRPLPGDVAIYYRPDKSVEHAGVVRFSEPKGLIIVSSKWGKFGRFLHKHDLTIYTDTNCTFYRSERKGNTLTGVDYTPASMP